MCTETQTMEQKSSSYHFNSGLLTEFKPLTQALDKAWNAFAPIVKPKRGPQAKARVHFDLFILNIIEAKGQPIIVSFDNNDYRYHSRYNPLGLTRALITMLKKMVEAGLVDRQIGDKAMELRSLVTPTKLLIDELAIPPLPLGAIRDNSELIVLKNEDDELEEYEETHSTETWREQLARYNDALSETHLWIRDAADPSKGELLSGVSSHVRKFNRGSFDCGGRLYSSRLQTLSKLERKRLYIDGERTCEPDFRGLHIAIAYAKVGVGDMIGDPYAFFADATVAEGDRRLTRIDAKMLALVALNARSRKGALISLSNKVPKGLSSKTRRSLWDAMLAHHSAIAHFFGNDVGIYFQRFDSDIMLLALSILLDHDIIAIPVHDSVVVAQKHEAAAIKALRQAAEAVLAEAQIRIRLPVNQPDLTYRKMQDLVLAGHDFRRDLAQWAEVDLAVSRAIGSSPKHDQTVSGPTTVGS